MLIVNTDYISGKEIETIQLVKGSIVFSKNVVRDIFAGLKTIIGGEIAGYSEMMSEARQKATERMIQEATAIGADAIVNVRYSTSSLMASAAEIVTAFRIYGLTKMQVRLQETNRQIQRVPPFFGYLQIESLARFSQNKSARDQTTPTQDQQLQC